MSDLPKGWIQSELDNLLSFVIGGDWGKEANYSDEEFEDVYCIRGTEFKKWRKEKGASAVHRRVKNTSLEKRKLLLNDILIEISGGGPDQPVGRTLLIDQVALNTHKAHPKVCTNFVRLARPHANINSTYLNYYLHSFYLSGEVKNYQGGSNNLRNLKFKDYSQILIPLAPENEQIRIANKLDSILAKVDTAQARLDKTPNILKRFRQSVLAAATSGELTKEWREKKGDDCSKWEILKLEDVCNSVTDGDHQAPPKAETGIPFLVISNVNKGVVDLDKASRWVPPSYFESLKDIRKPQKGDILYTVTGSYGIPVEVHDNAEFCFQRHIAILKPNHSLVDKDYLFHFLSSSNAFEQATKYATGTAQKTLPLRGLRGFEVTMPSMDEQKEIVRQVESLFTMADTVEKQFLEAKVRTNRLVQSTLAKAFRGELVPQNEKDEPASILLEKIQAELAKKPVKKKKVVPKKKVVKPKETKVQVAKQEVVKEKHSKEVTTKVEKELTLSWSGKNAVYVEKAFKELKDSTFTIEQFESVTGFSKSYEELKNLVLSLLKGEAGNNKPLLEIADWDEKTSNYLLRLKESL